MDPRFELVTAPASEPVTLAEAKAHAKIEIDDDDALIASLISTARERIEQATGRVLIEQEWKATLDAWPAVAEGDRFRRIGFAVRPVLSIDAVSVDGVALEADDWRGDGVGALARRRPELVVTTDADESEGEITSDGVEIEFTAGYGDAGDVPASLVLAVKMMVTHYYEARGATSPQGIYHQLIPEGVQALIQPFVVLEI